jgi:hypothetical protein
MNKFSKTSEGRRSVDVDVNGVVCTVDVEYVLRIEGEYPSHDYPGHSKTSIEHLIVHDCCDPHGVDIDFTDEIEGIVRQKILP